MFITGFLCGAIAMLAGIVIAAVLFLRKYLREETLDFPSSIDYNKSG